MVETRVRALALLSLLLASALAGCLGDDEAPADPGPIGAGTGDGSDDPARNLTGSTRPSVEGFVLDASRAPLAGATVAVQNEGLQAQTDERGHFSFAGFVDNQQYVLIAEAAGFKKKAQQVIAIDDKVVRLDFILDEVPTEKPYDEVLERVGLISCQAFAGAGHDHGGNGTEFEQRCAGLAEDPNAVQIMDFQIAQGVAGIVVEVQWDSSQPLADFFMVTVEAAGFGDLDKQFGQVIGPSVLKVEIPQADVARYYAGQGGIVRVIVDVHFEDDDEQAAGVAFAFQEDFMVRVSNFYVTPQPQSYTAFPDA